MNKAVLAGVWVLMGALVLWVGITFYKAYQPKTLILQGEIDAQSYNIGSKLPGRITEIKVKKGEYVRPGDLIFTLSSPEVEAKMAQAKAAEGVASAQKNEADAGARKQEVQAAQDQWGKAKAAEALMKTTFDRIDKLYRQGVLSRQKRDEVATKYKAAKYDSSAARQMAMMAKDGARIEVKEAASAQKKVYQAKVDEVDVYLNERSQYAFHKGEVTQILIQEGELSPVGFPVVTTVDISDAWAKFSVREDYLRHFRKGKVFSVKIPALGDEKYRFKVSDIAVMGEYATWRATESGKGFDMKSFEVELRPEKPIEGLRVGMSVLLELGH
jgi:HlyD family secretion protein